MVIVCVDRGAHPGTGGGTGMRHAPPGNQLPSAHAPGLYTCP